MEMVILSSYMHTTYVPPRWAHSSGAPNPVHSFVRSVNDCECGAPPKKIGESWKQCIHIHRKKTTENEAEIFNYGPCEKQNSTDAFSSFRQFVYLFLFAAVFVGAVSVVTVIYGRETQKKSGARALTLCYIELQRFRCATWRMTKVTMALMSIQERRKKCMRKRLIRTLCVTNHRFRRHVFPNHFARCEFIAQHQREQCRSIF